MKLKLHGGKMSVELNDSFFAADFNEALVHQVITAYLSGRRRGTKAQKTRAQVRGGGAKPWRQKGTGRARVGSSRNPVWVGGGRAFAAQPRSFSQKVNRKMYRGAMKSMFSELIRQDRLVIAEEFSVSAPKTKELKSKLKELGLESVLVVIEAFDANLFLAARNLSRVHVQEVQAVDPASVASYDHVLMTVAAVKLLEERLQ